MKTQGFHAYIDGGELYVRRDVWCRGKWRPQHLELVAGDTRWVEHPEGAIMKPFLLVGDDIPRTELTVAA